MRKEPPSELVKIFDELAKDMGAEYYTISTPIICDSCEDDDKEAFPYYVKDRHGKEWEHLCNGCFDKLGCRYDKRDEPIARCQKCGELVYWNDTELHWACDCMSTIERPDEYGLPGIMTADWPPYWVEVEGECLTSTAP